MLHLTLLALLGLAPNLFPADPQTRDDFDALLDEHAPHVNALGQPAHADWPGKPATLDDLRADAEAEAARLAGLAPPTPREVERVEATGAWRLARHLDGWRLVSPVGEPTFYLGVDGATDARSPATPIDGRRFLFADLPDRTTPAASAGYVVNPRRDVGQLGVEYFDHRSANLARRDGPDWKRLARDRATRRLAALGFTGSGRLWGPHAEGPHLRVISLPETFDRLDPWDDRSLGALRQALREQAAPRRNDRRVVAFTLEPDPLPTRADTLAVLAEEGTRAKQALLDLVLAEAYGGSEVAMLADLGAASARRVIDDPVLPDGPVTTKYHDAHVAAAARAVRGAFDQLAGDALTAGDRRWADLGLVEVAAGDNVAIALEDVSGPTLVTLLHPVDYRGERGRRPGGGTRPTEADAGAAYAADLAAARADRNVVGVLLRAFADEPATGVGPGMTADDRTPRLVAGPARAGGLVDVTDRLKWGYAEAVRAANLDLPDTPVTD